MSKKNDWTFLAIPESVIFYPLSLLGINITYVGHFLVMSSLKLLPNLQMCGI